MENTPKDTFLILGCAFWGHLCSLSEPQGIGRIREKVGGSVPCPVHT